MSAFKNADNLPDEDELLEGEVTPKEVTPPATKQSTPKLSKLESLSKYYSSGKTIRERAIPEQQKYCGDWYMEGTLGFIYAPPGIGKSWLSMHLTTCLADGKDFGPFECIGGLKVLYIDGEMGIANLKERIELLKSDSVTYLCTQDIIEDTGKFINLADKKYQNMIIDECLEHKFDVLVIDNLSCLFSGVCENDADDWDLVLPWLLELRSMGVSVIIVHHTNKSGTSMRGTSRREDAAQWIIKLSRVSDDEETEGATFMTSFDKNREAKKRPPDLRWEFITKGTVMDVQWREAKTRDLILELLDEGNDLKIADIAETLGIKRNAVSNQLKRLIRDKQVTKLSSGLYSKLTS